ncbi:MAG: acyltransferase family protein, partial [Aestuariibaculum sp.]
MTKRLVSLDVFRGITILFMILVNTPGSWSYVYPPLRHADWNGCTPTDLVFPFFLFIVGISVFFAFKKNNSTLNKKTFLKISKRVCIIFLLGFLLNLYPFFDFDNVRIMGVLQRIALAYGIGAVFCLGLGQRSMQIVLLVLLLGYWAMLFFLGESTDPYALEGNIVRTFDLLVLGENHVYKGFGVPFDPEGLLSSIPAVATVIIGYLVGQAMSNRDSILRKLRVMAVCGLAMVIAGYLWGMVFPINKALWTSSYVLYTAGLGTLFFALLIFVIDLKKVVLWTRPFIHFG